LISGSQDEVFMFRGFMLSSLLTCLAAGLACAQAPQSPLSNAAATSAEPPGSAATSDWPKEDWAHLQVDRKQMRILSSGAVLGKSESANYTSELVRMQWRPADPIDMFVIKPRGVEKPRVAIYLYSYPSSIDKFRDDSWCKAATEHGLAAVGLVSALTGDRFRARPMREWFIPELQESIGSSVHDVQLIIDFLAQRGDLTVDKVGIFGQGSGATIAILAAAADPRIGAVDALNPWGDWPDWLKDSPQVPDSLRSSVLAPEFLQKAAAVEPITYLPQLKGRALRVQQVLDYSITPALARDKIAEAVPADDLVKYQNRAAHAEAWKTFGLSGWLAKQLNAEPAQQTAREGK
jgi:hypothetical protein